jgi:hypothetical protein
MMHVSRSRHGEKVFFVALCEIANPRVPCGNIKRSVRPSPPYVIWRGRTKVISSLALAISIIIQRELGASPQDHNLRSSKNYRGIS